MRKNCIRHWVHAICDLLPLLVIPIFALQVRSDNGYQPIIVTIGEQVIEEKTYNQLVYNGLPENTDNIYHDIIDIEVDNGWLHAFNGEYDYTIRFNIDAYGETGDKLYLKYVYEMTYNVNELEDWDSAYVILKDDDRDFYYKTMYSAGQVSSNVEYFEQSIITLSSDFVSDNDLGLFFAFFPVNSDWELLSSFNLYIKDVELFNLTKIYGAGNEPDIVNFVSDFPDDYYDYGRDIFWKNVVVQDFDAIYDDTDVGSQMVYTLYNTCDKYFNFNHVGVFQDLYNWFQINLFNGYMPIGFNVVWNVVLYEFIMDLIFLTYMVFMFVIDFTEHMIDSFFAKSYRGGR